MRHTTKEGEWELPQFTCVDSRLWLAGFGATFLLLQCAFLPSSGPKVLHTKHRHNNNNNSNITNIVIIAMMFQALNLTGVRYALPNHWAAQQAKNTGKMWWWRRWWQWWWWWWLISCRWSFEEGWSNETYITNKAQKRNVIIRPWLIAERKAMVVVEKPKSEIPGIKKNKQLNVFLLLMPPPSWSLPPSTLPPLLPLRYILIKYKRVKK